MNPAQHSRIEREAYPERYCDKCLWNVARSGPCPRHKAKASPVDFICKNCGETRTTCNPREETICRHIEADAGNPHGNHVITTHVWERTGKAIATTSSKPFWKELLDDTDGLPF